LNLRRGAFHPGYFIEEQDISPILSWIPKIVIIGS